MAKEPTFKDTLQVFETKFKRVLKAKQEMEVAITKKTIKNANIYKGDATNLVAIDTQSIDYIYTDTPYGKKIAYLDL